MNVGRNENVFSYIGLGQQEIYSSRAYTQAWPKTPPPTIDASCSRRSRLIGHKERQRHMHTTSGDNPGAWNITFSLTSRQASNIDDSILNFTRTQASVE